MSQEDEWAAVTTDESWENTEAEEQQENSKSWMCEQCECIYTLDQTECTKCHLLRADIRKRKRPWICPQCTLENQSEAIKCLACEVPKKTKQTLVKEKQVDWFCVNCQEKNGWVFKKCQHCHTHHTDGQKEASNRSRELQRIQSLPRAPLVRTLVTPVEQDNTHSILLVENPYRNTEAIVFTTARFLSESQLWNVRAFNLEFLALVEQLYHGRKSYAPLFMGILKLGRILIPELAEIVFGYTFPNIPVTSDNTFTSNYAILGSHLFYEFKTMVPVQRNDSFSLLLYLWRKKTYKCSVAEAQSLVLPDTARLYDQVLGFLSSYLDLYAGSFSLIHTENRKPILSSSEIPLSVNGNIDLNGNATYATDGYSPLSSPLNQMFISNEYTVILDLLRYEAPSEEYELLDDYPLGDTKKIHLLEWSVTEKQVEILKALILRFQKRKQVIDIPRSKGLLSRAVATKSLEILEMVIQFIPHLQLTDGSDEWDAPLRYIIEEWSVVLVSVSFALDLVGTKVHLKKFPSSGKTNMLHVIVKRYLTYTKYSNLIRYLEEWCTLMITFGLKWEMRNENDECPIHLLSSSILKDTEFGKWISAQCAPLALAPPAPQIKLPSETTHAAAVSTDLKTPVINVKSDDKEKESIELAQRLMEQDSASTAQYRQSAKGWWCKCPHGRVFVNLITAANGKKHCSGCWTEVYGRAPKRRTKSAQPSSAGAAYDFDITGDPSALFAAHAAFSAANAANAASSAAHPVCKNESTDDDGDFMPRHKAKGGWWCWCPLENDSTHYTTDKDGKKYCEGCQEQIFLDQPFASFSASSAGDVGAAYFPGASKDEPKALPVTYAASAAAAQPLMAASINHPIQWTCKCSAPASASASKTAYKFQTFIVRNEKNYCRGCFTLITRENTLISNPLVQPSYKEKSDDDFLTRKTYREALETAARTPTQTLGWSCDKCNDKMIHTHIVKEDSKPHCRDCGTLLTPKNLQLWYL